MVSSSGISGGENNHVSAKVSRRKAASKSCSGGGENRRNGIMAEINVMAAKMMA